MLPLFDMLSNAQGGRGMELLARQFNLSQQQAQLAVEALLPAFSQGLKRNATDPYGVGDFLAALSTGQHAKYFDDAAKAFQPEGVQEGNGILGHLFGSKELSRAVAGQAAQATGIAEATMKQMLPVLASMIMGGLFKQSSGQVPGSGQGVQANPLQQMFEQMMQQGMGGGQMRQPRPQAPQPEANPFDNPFGRILEGMFGGGGNKDAPQAPKGPFSDNPFGQIFEEMTRGTQARRSEPQAAPKPKAKPDEPQRNPYDELFGQMFEAGAKQRDEYQKGVESIFDQYLQGMAKRR